MVFKRNSKPIRSMAEPKVIVERDVRSYQDKRIEHLMKCFLFPGNPAFRHWCVELANFPKKVPILKNTKKLPKESELYQWLWGGIEDIAEQVVRKEARNFEGTGKYGDIPYFEVEDAVQFLTTYHKWLATKLSTDALGVDYKEVEDKILELLYN